MRITRLVGSASLVLLSTTLSAQDVTYDYDKAANFSTFKTYTWVRGTPLNDELNHKRIVNAVDAQLASKGFSKVEMAGSPLIGTLVVDMVDARSKTIVWRGTATKEVDLKASPEKREKNINKAAEKLFKNYPPKQ